jgi:hypothetical protein
VWLGVKMKLTPLEHEWVPVQGDVRSRTTHCQLLFFLHFFVHSLARQDGSELVRGVIRPCACGGQQVSSGGHNIMVCRKCHQWCPKSPLPGVRVEQMECI